MDVDCILHGHGDISKDYFYIYTCMHEMNYEPDMLYFMMVLPQGFPVGIISLQTEFVTCNKYVSNNNIGLVYRQLFSLHPIAIVFRMQLKIK